MNFYIGLGSNLGFPEENLCTASTLLENSDLGVYKQSSIYCTEPVGNQKQPWFLNQVVWVESSLKPDKVLSVLKSIEKKMGRIKAIPKGPRIIDLDILLADDLILETRDLSVPHPELHNRRFVLIPLVEIAPHILHPVLNATVSELLEQCSDNSEVKHYRYRNEK